MRLMGHIPDDPRHLTNGLILQLQDFSDNIRTVEIPLRDAFVDDYRIRLIQGRCRVSLHHRHGKDLEESRVGKDQAMVLDKVTVLLHHDIPCIIGPHHLLHLGVIGLQRPGQGFGGYRRRKAGIVEKNVRIDPVDPIRLCIVFVVAQLIDNVEDDEQADAQPCRQPDNVDGGKGLAFPKVAQSDFEIIF